MLLPVSLCSKHVYALLASVLDTFCISLQAASLIGIQSNRCKLAGHDDSDDDGDSDGLHERKKGAGLVMRV